MKKYSTILMFVILFSLTTFNVQATNSRNSASNNSYFSFFLYYGLYIYDYEITNDGKDIGLENEIICGTAKISAQVNNDTYFDANNISVIAVLIDKKEILDISASVISVGKKSNAKVCNLSLNVPEIDLSGAEIKLYIWNSLNDAIPIMEHPIVFPEKTSSFKVYPKPDGIAESDKYAVRLSQDNGLTWKKSFTYITECLDKSVDKAYYSDYIGGFTASYTNFEMSENVPITVEITKLWGNSIKSADVKPHSKNISSTITDNKVIFTITEPSLIAVEIDGYPNNGTIDHSICIFANSKINEEPDITNSSVRVVYPGDEIPQYTDETWTTLYFAPGVHHIGKGYTAAPNKEYYLSGGAYLFGTFTDLDPKIRDGSTRLKIPTGGKGAKVFGYGVLCCTGIDWLDGSSNSKYDVNTNHAIDLYNNKVAIEGITIIDTANHAIMMAGWAGNENAAIIENVKVLNWRVNGDGIHVFCHGVVNNCFLRTQDDSIYISSGTKNNNNPLEPVEPVPQTISNITTWNDVNGSAFIFAGSGNTTLSNCDVLYNRCVFPIGEPISKGSGGFVFNLRQQNSGDITANVAISDIRVEDPLYGAIIRPKVWNTDKRRKGIFFLNMQNSGKNLGSVFTNIHFKNISVDSFVTNEDNTAAPARQNIFNGLSEECNMGSITIENLKIGGTRITNENAKDFNFVFINANDIEFK